MDGSPYSVVPSAALGTGLNNYNIIYVNGSLTVNKASVGLSLISSASTSTKGRSVTFTATVTDPRATGTVTLQDGETTLGSITLADGTGTYTISTLAAGSHSITAVYSGDANLAGSTSPPINHTVKKAAGGNWGLIIGLILAGILVSLFFFFLIFFSSFFFFFFFFF
mgnify:CR=1 FL=1